MRPRRAKEHLSTLTLLVSIVIFLLLFRPTFLGGDVTYVIATGSSMEPLFHHGDLLVLKRAPSYQVGDIVGYKPSLPAEVSSEHKLPLIVHRIVKFDERGWFVTKGDNFDKPDPYAVEEDLIVGKLWFSVPYLGYLFMFVRKPFFLAMASSLLFFLLVGVPMILRGEEQSRDTLVDRRSCGDPRQNSRLARSRNR